MKDFAKKSIVWAGFLAVFSLISFAINLFYKVRGNEPGMVIRVLLLIYYLLLIYFAFISYTIQGQTLIKNIKMSFVNGFWRMHQYYLYFLVTAAPFILMAWVLNNVTNQIAIMACQILIGLPLLSIVRVFLMHSILEQQ